MTKPAAATSCAEQRSSLRTSDISGLEMALRMRGETKPPVSSSNLAMPHMPPCAEPGVG